MMAFLFGLDFCELGHVFLRKKHAMKRRTRPGVLLAATLFDAYEAKAIQQQKTASSASWLFNIFHYL